MKKTGIIALASLLLSACLTKTPEGVKPVKAYQPPPRPVTKIVKKELTPAQIGMVKDIVLQYLNDPYTAQFRNIFMTEFWQDEKFIGKTYCGQVNAKNLYGAFTGYQWFGYFPDNSTKMLFQESQHPSDWHMIHGYCLDAS